MSRNNKIASLLLLPLLMLCLSAQAQQQRAETYWDTNGVNLGREAHITLGDQIDLVVSVSSKDHIPVVVWPTHEHDGLVVVSQRLDTLQKDGWNTVRQLTTITGFEIGPHGAAIQVGVMENGQMMPLLTGDSLLLTVDDVPNVDTASLDIKDIANIVREPITFWEVFRWVLLALVVAALVWVAVIVVRKRKQHQPIITLPKAPPVPADQQAINELERLRVKQLWQSGKLKEYHTELTDIVREYLHAQYGIDSAEMTSDQTLEAYRECRGWDTDNDALLRQILRTADMVKFAKHEPQGFEHDLSMKNANSFVQACAAKERQQTSTANN